MNYIECPTSIQLSDGFFDFFHQLIDSLDELEMNRICLSGSLSLAIQGIISRPITAIDICACAPTYDKLVAAIRSRDVKELRRVDPTEHAFYIGDTKNMVCTFKHSSMNVMSVTNIHGTMVQLYPASAIIEYKMVFLNALNHNNSACSLEHLRRHMNDVIAYFYRQKRLAPSTAATIRRLVASVNRFCEAKSFPIAYDTSLRGVPVEVDAPSRALQFEPVAQSA